MTITPTPIDITSDLPDHTPSALVAPATGRSSGPDPVAAVWEAARTSLWVAAALGCVIERGFDTPIPADDPAAAVLAELGLLTPDAHGEGTLVPLPDLIAFTAGREAGVAADIRATLGRAMAALSDPPGSGWQGRDDLTLMAQGRASAQGGPYFASVAVPGLPGLAERFAAPGGRVLDVGVGVAQLACAIAEHLPGAEVVGIDPFGRALELARATVAARGLGDRVTLRQQGVETLEDIDRFDLAWMPAPFIPPAVLFEGLIRVRRALRPGGWLVLASASVADGLAGAITRLDVAHSGGTLISIDERIDRLEAAGFVDLTTPLTPPGAPELIAARRPG